MAHAIIIAAVILGFVWLCIVSRGFRWSFAILTAGFFGWLIMANDNAVKQKGADEITAEAKRQSDAARQAELWAKVPPSLVELRAPLLFAPKYGSDDYELTGSIKNLSAEKLAAFEIEVTAQDCLDPKSCEIIGRSSKTIWTDIPAKEVRAVSGKMTLLNLPKPRGRLVTGYVVRRVYAGDYFDQWGLMSDRK